MYIERDRQCFLVLDHSLDFYAPPPNNPENQNFEKMKKNKWRYHHFTQAYHKWQSYDTRFLRYEMKCNRQNFLSSWVIPNSPKNENITQKKNTPGDIIILNKFTKNHDHRLYCSWDMARDGCNCYFSIWAILFPFTPLTAQKLKISKKWKKTPGDIIILHMCTKNCD